jgi:5-methylcytosine-specific restriction endonuclease McrA
MHAGCLALNASYEPMAMLSTQRAVRLLLDGKAEVVEQDKEAVIRWGRGAMPRPNIIRLKKFIHVPQKFRRKVTNTFLFARDSYTCQYCGKDERTLKGRSNKLTRDHVLPQSRGGLNTWENCVTACSECNTRKDNRTPKEAGMVLLTTPTEPHLVALIWTVRKLTPMQRKYVTMFYGGDVAAALDS